MALVARRPRQLSGLPAIVLAAIVLAAIVLAAIVLAAIVLAAMSAIFSAAQAATLH